MKVKYTISLDYGTYRVLRFECAGRSAASMGCFLGFDCLQARVPVYARPEGRDLRAIQVKP